MLSFSRFRVLGTSAVSVCSCLSGLEHEILLVLALRKRLRFELLKTTVIALRGYRGKKIEDSNNIIGELDLNLDPNM